LPSFPDSLHGRWEAIWGAFSPEGRRFVDLFFFFFYAGASVRDNVLFCPRETLVTASLLPPALIPFDRDLHWRFARPRVFFLRLSGDNLSSYEFCFLGRRRSRGDPDLSFRPPFASVGEAADCFPSWRSVFFLFPFLVFFGQTPVFPPGYFHKAFLGYAVDASSASPGECLLDLPSGRRTAFSYDKKKTRIYFTFFPFDRLSPARERDCPQKPFSSLPHSQWTGNVFPLSGYLFFPGASEVASERWLPSSQPARTPPIWTFLIPPLSETFFLFVSSSSVL